MEHRDIDRMCREVKFGHKNWKNNVIMLDAEIRNLREKSHNKELETNVAWYLRTEADYMDRELYFAAECFIKQSDPRLEV